MNIGELFIKLGFDVDESKLKGFTDGINGLQTDMLKLSAAGAAAVYGFDKFISGSIDSATALENLHDITGESTAEIERWESAGHLANIAMSYEEVGHSIASVSAAISAASMGENTNLFYKMGLQWQNSNGTLKTSVQLLNEIRSRMPSIMESYKQWGDTNGRHSALLADLQTLGVSQGMWQSLIEKQEKFNKDASQYDVVDSTLKRNQALGQNIDTLILKLQDVQRNIVGDMAPSITEALDGVMPHLNNIYEGFKAIPDFIKESAAVIAAGLALMFSPLFAVGAAVAVIIEGLDKLGQISKAGGIDAWNKQNEPKHLNQMQEISDKWKGKTDKSWWDIIMQNGAATPSHAATGATAVQAFQQKPVTPSAADPKSEFEEARAKQQAIIHSQAYDKAYNANAAAGMIQNNVINVNTNADAKETAKATVDELQKMTNQTFGQVNNGVNR